jgi:hypothetical protein
MLFNVYKFQSADILTKTIMAPSQLKQLKASLHENRILGPQQSKKQKRANAKSDANRQNRIQRNAALQGIRERFNPFEIKAPVKSVKFGVATSSKAIRDRDYVRPGVTKSLGEERVIFSKLFDLLHGTVLTISVETCNLTQRTSLTK